jgi:hypothetical protein
LCSFAATQSRSVLHDLKIFEIQIAVKFQDGKNNIVIGDKQISQGVPTDGEQTSHGSVHTASRFGANSYRILV